MTKLHPHCGRCSQCIDRRFGILAAGQEHEDPAEAYKVDLFLGERTPGPDREMALAYVRSATAVNQMTDVAFFARYGETSRIVGFFPETAGKVASRIFDLHQRNASTVCRVFDEAIALNASALRQGELPANCLLPLIVGRNPGNAPFPAQSSAPPQSSVVVQDIRIAIDESRKRVVFDRWGEVKGVSAALITILAKQFRQAVRDELAPEHYPFIKTSELMRRAKCDSGETFRRRVLSCRNAITKLAMNSNDSPPPIDAVIENIQWRGYRLNPDRVRLLAMEELSESD